MIMLCKSRVTQRTGIIYDICHSRSEFIVIWDNTGNVSSVPFTNCQVTYLLSNDGQTTIKSYREEATIKSI